MPIRRVSSIVLAVAVVLGIVTAAWLMWPAEQAQRKDASAPALRVDDDARVEAQKAAGGHLADHDIAHDHDAAGTRIFWMQSSTVYDATDPVVVAENTDFVFEGVVVGELGRDGKTTRYAVDVVDPLTSGVDGRVTIAQPGWRDDDAIYQDVAQPLLEPGNRYLLATNVEGDSKVLTLAAGPVSGSRIGPISDTAALGEGVRVAGAADRDAIASARAASGRTAADLEERERFLAMRAQKGE